MKSTYDEVMDIIITTLNVDRDEINGNTNLFDDLNVDSINIFEIVSQIEENWDFSLTDYPELLDEIETVNSLVYFLEHNLGDGGINE